VLGDLGSRLGHLCSGASRVKAETGRVTPNPAIQQSLQQLSFSWRKREV